MKLDVILERLKDVTVIRRLLACLLSALKSNGSHGVHCELKAADNEVIDLYVKHGFIDVSSLMETVPTGTVIMGRIM